MKGHLLKVYNLFAKHKNLTDHQIERLLEINPNSIRPARLKLEEMGIITRTNTKKKVKDRGNYTVYQLVKEVDPDNINKKKSKKVSKSTIVSKLKCLNTKIRQLQKSVNKIINTI